MTALERMRSLPEETARKAAKVLNYLRAGQKGCAYAVLEHMSVEELDSFLELAEAMQREKPWRNGQVEA